MEQEKRLNELAEQALSYARNTLFVSMRFMETALCRLSFVPMPIQTISTDGRCLFYNSRYVLMKFRDNAEQLTREYLHIILHCIFRHFFVSYIREPLWDLACDMAVENMINDLGFTDPDPIRASNQQNILNKLRSELKVVSAEKIYSHYNGISDEECVSLRTVFMADDHSGWYSHSDNNGNPGGSGNETGDNNSDNSPDDANNNHNEPDMQNDSRSSSSRRDLQKMWEDVSRQIQLDLETFSKNRGTESGSMIKNLESINRERYDYTSFLKKFAVRQETMKVNEDEFDYIFYTYGLQLYKDMPLIEPLEYKEVKRIRDFIIAIDSSGSTYDHLAQKFVQKTYNILKSTESFFSRINVHIVQCDTEIQEAIKITTQEEFDLYMENMQLKGGGCTDFVPVFEYADAMIANKEFTNLKGIIYFTDGYGRYPAKQPDYLAAFVFIEEDPELPEFPVWAISLVLDEEQI